MTPIRQEELDEMEQYFRTYLIVQSTGRRNEKDVYCTSCRAQFTVSKPRKSDEDIYNEFTNLYRAKHRDSCCCPSCGNNAQVIVAGRMGTRCHDMWEQIHFVILRAEKDGWLSAVALTCIKNYSGRNWDVCVREDVERIYLFRPGTALCWKNGWHYNGAWHRTWERMSNITDPYPTTSGMWGYSAPQKYILIGADQITESSLKYCGAESVDFRMKTDTRKCNGLVRYLGEYCHRPQLELCAKLGMHDVINDLVFWGTANAKVVNWRAKSLPAFLRLPKSEAKQYMKLKRKTVKILQVLQASRKAEGKCDWESARFFDGTSRRELAMDEIMPRLHGRKLRQVTRYLDRQGSTATLWPDYIDMAQRLHYDLTRDDVFLPKNLRERHDGAAANIRAEEDAAAKEKYRRRFKRMQKRMEFAHDGLCIVIPQSGEEIRTEGKVQKICVGAYAERHLRGETTILFLRNADAPEEPMVTIEVTPKTPWDIRQIHGYRNDAGVAREDRPENKYKDFLDIWKGWMKRGSPRDSQGKPIIETTKENAS